MSEEQDLQMAQREAVEGVVETVGLAADLFSAAASMVGGPSNTSSSGHNSAIGESVTTEQKLETPETKAVVETTASTFSQTKTKPPSLDDAPEEALQQQPAPAPAREDAPQQQPASAPELEIPKPEESQAKQEQSTEENQSELEKARATRDKRMSNEPASKMLDSKATATTPHQAKQEVIRLGKGIESELGEILGSKVDMRIYSASTLVYPPKSKTKITPEMSDKLNRAFSNPESVKGTITLSIRNDEGQLKPIYQVSNGKVKLDILGLRNPVNQHLPEPKQSVLATPESSSEKVEPKQVPDEPEKTQNSNLNSKQVKTVAQTEPKPEAKSVDDHKDDVIKAQEQRILELEKSVERLEKMEAKLKEAGVPQGITDGINTSKQTLGQRFRAAVKEMAVTAGAAAISATSHAIKTAGDLINKAEASQVYKSGKYLANNVGTPQPDGSKTFTKGKDLDLKLEGDDLIVSNKQGKVLFQANSKSQGMTPNASMAEAMSVKRVAFAAQQLKAQQQQQRQLQTQAQTQKVGGMKR